MTPKESAVQWFFNHKDDLDGAKKKERELLIFAIQEAYMNGRNDESDGVEIAEGMSEIIDAILKYTIDRQ